MTSFYSRIKKHLLIVTMVGLTITASNVHSLTGTPVEKFYFVGALAFEDYKWFASADEYGANSCRSRPYAGKEAIESTQPNYEGYNIFCINTESGQKRSLVCA